MDHAEIARRLTSLEARMSRMEALMQQLLLTLTSSQAHVERNAHIRGILQELRHSSANNPIMSTPQERPEMEAIRQALLAGNKLKAIQMYRSLYGVSLQEAQDVINNM